MPANIEQILPDAFNADTWALSQLSRLTTNYQVGVSDSSAFLTPLPLWKYGAWRRTIGGFRRTDAAEPRPAVQPDLELIRTERRLPPFEQPDRPQDANDLQPRVGFACQLNDRTVIRGGSGLYYNDILNTNVLWPQSPLTIAVIRVNNDGRADFAANPFNGPLPTYAQALQRFCYVNTAPGCLLRDLQEQAPIPEYAHVTHAWQNSIGVVASVRKLRGAPGRLREHEEPRREIDSGQRQHHLQSGHRYPVPIFGCRSPRVPLYGVVG